MAFISKYIFKKGPLKDLPQFIKDSTNKVLEQSKSDIQSCTSKESLKNPNPIEILQKLDKVSNNCCKIIDSCTISLKCFNFDIFGYQDSLAQSINSINDFFGSQYLNLNKELLNLLVRMQCNPILLSILDEEDQFFLNLLIKDLKFAQEKPKSTNQLDQIQYKLYDLQRQFYHNLNQQKYQLELDMNELKSVPNSKFVKKYSKQFNDKQNSILMQFENKQDFDFLKFSQLPSVRQKQFLTFSNNCKSNIDILVQIFQLRQKLATSIYNDKNYFTRQVKQQTIQIRGDFKQKLEQILKQLRKVSEKDLENIMKITGEKDIRFFDLAYLKEKIKALLLQSDPNNIQMLTCFTFQNVLNGLQILTKQIFKKNLKISTLSMNFENNTFEELDGILDYQQLRNQNYEVIVFKIEIEKLGTIILDLFDRKYKQPHATTSTLTEIGCSKNQNQLPLAYIVDCLPIDVHFLNFDQVKTIFHEYGHALNIALSSTKYQYYSCARSTIDLVEIPSHFTELFLNEYQFIRQFAINENNQQPIQRSIFEKMMLCEELFKNLQLEETIYYTLLDIEMNSFQKNQVITEEVLVNINKVSLTKSFTCNKVLQKQFQIPKIPNKNDVDSIINDTIYEKDSNIEVLNKAYDILFFESKYDHNYNEEQNKFEFDSQKLQDFEKNYLFTKFHHLIDYDATYYSYLLARLSSQRLYDKYYKPFNYNGLSNEIQSLFTKGGIYRFQQN